MIDNSTTTKFTKTLVIRNTPDSDFIWQIYHVQKMIEAERLSANANNNGFYGITLEDYHPKYKETWPDWRETEGGKEIIKD